MPSLMVQHKSNLLLVLNFRKENIERVVFVYWAWNGVIHILSTNNC